MAKNKIVKTFMADATWTCPAGVESIRITTKYPALKVETRNSNFFYKNYRGNLYGWGTNASGECGVGDIVKRSSPTLISTTKFDKISSSYSGTSYRNYLALKEDGSAYTWGNNTFGQAGDNTGGTGAAYSTPTLVSGGLTFKDIFGMGDRNYGILEDGTLYGWGSNNTGNLGIGTTASVSVPTVLSGKYKKVCETAGTIGAIGLTTAGDLYAWGQNTNGILGDGTITARSTPTLVLGSHTYKDIFTMSGGSCFGLTTTGALYSWGLNADGQLGVGDTTDRSSPVLISGITFKTLATGTSSAWALDTNNILYAWGSNTIGGLGVGDVDPRSTPTVVLGGLTFKKIINVGSSYLGLTYQGQVYGCGSNNKGQLGLGDTTARSSPTLISGYLFSDIARVGTGVIATSGTNLYFWGENKDGEGGVGDITARSTPTLVVGSRIVDSYKRTTTQTVKTIPGTTYNINLTQTASFDGVELYTGNVDEITLEYYA